MQPAARWKGRCRGDDCGAAVETQPGGGDVEPCPCGLAGEAAALRVPGEDVAELDLVPLRPGVQPGATEEGSGAPVEESALTEAVLAPDLVEPHHLGCRALGVECGAADVAGHVRFGVQLRQYLGVLTGEGWHEQSPGPEVHGTR